LSLLARRLKRADEAIEAAVDQAMVALQAMADLSPDSGELDPIVFDAEGYARLPAEIALRLTGRAVAKLGCEGPVELGKLEALNAALDAAQKTGQKTGKVRFRRSLAGAMVTLSGGEITVERAPPRRANSLTKRRGPQAKRPKAR
jgi:tRNA(Ile)-lysidine synthase